MQRTRRVTASLTLLLASQLVLGAARAGPAWPGKDALDAFVEREHLQGRFDGVVLIGRGDDLVYQRSMGEADRRTGAPHSVDKVWRWASVSKQVTAVLVMQLVAQGRLSLDDRLRQVLPTFKSPNSDVITVRQLLEHRSGLPNPDPCGQEADASEVPDFYQQRPPGAAQALDAALQFCSGDAVSTPTSPGSR